MSRRRTCRPGATDQAGEGGSEHARHCVMKLRLRRKVEGKRKHRAGGTLRHSGRLVLGRAESGYETDATAGRTQSSPLLPRRTPA
jgi:hypothetical protein